MQLPGTVYMFRIVLSRCQRSSGSHRKNSLVHYWIEREGTQGRRVLLQGLSLLCISIYAILQRTATVFS